MAHIGSRETHAQLARSIALACALIMTGCNHRAAPTASEVPLAIAPTPVALAGFFQSCWRNRLPDEYRLILTEDFEFDFATGDSAGEAYRTIPWDRTDELLCAAHMFRDGTPTQPPATSIALDYTQNPSDDPDPDSRKNPKWHRLLTLQVLLRVNIPHGTWEVRGPVYFYVVRGDSAQIPPDLVVQGVHADSTQWWLEKWVDGTLQGSPPAVTGPARPLRTMPGRSLTWGYVKSIYR